MTIPLDPHAWFREHLDAYLAGGLLPDERLSLEAHAVSCETCNQLLVEARDLDRSLHSLFNPLNPSAQFEEKLIMNLHIAQNPRLMMQPAVVRSAAAVAAAILLGGFGLLGHRVLQSGKFPELSLPNISLPEFAWLPGERRAKVKTGSHLKQMGVAMSLAAPTTQADFGFVALPAATPPAALPEELAKKLDTQLRTTVRYGDQHQAIDLYAFDAVSDSIKAPQAANGGDGAVVLGRAVHGEKNYAGRQRGKMLPSSGAGPAHKDDSNLYPVDTSGGARGDDLTHNWSLQTANGVVTEESLRQASVADKKPLTSALGYGAARPSIQTGRAITVNRGLEIVDGEKKEALVVLADESKGKKVPTDYYSELNQTKAAEAPPAMYYKPPASPESMPPLKVALVDGSTTFNDLAGQKLTEAGGRTLVQRTEKERELGESNKPVDPVERGAEPAKAVPVEQPKSGPDEKQIAAQQQIQRKIIRNGQMEFEVDSFDSSFMQLSKIVAEESGYVASTDSEKLSNGKVKGTVTLRVPPDHLDVLVLKLRGLGDLKNQRIAAQDVTKQYTDLESGLRAARTMEERLLEIIKSGKGEVKDLVEAEKQLGTYRERIEQIEGELRYYSNLVSLSTLNITLFERDIKTPTAAFETEEVQAGIEVEDVEKARADALKAIDDAKGRVIESSLKKLDAGQLTASIVAEMTPEAAGAFTDRLKQLGRVARLEAERKQTTQGGTGAPTGVKMERKATRFNISIYNLANIAPRETVNMTVAAADVETAYKAILGAMNSDDAAIPGRIVSSTLNSQKADQTTGAITLEVKADRAAGIEAIIRSTGDVLHLTVTENPDANNVTRTKRGYSISLLATAQVPPRETQTLQVAARNVPATYARLMTALQDPKQPSRILSSQLNEQDRQNITGQVDVEVPRTAIGAIDAIINSGDSDVYSRNNSRAEDNQNRLDTKVRLSISLVAADRLPPRESTTIAVEVADVDKTLQDVVSSGGLVVERQISKQQNGRVSGHVVIDVPLTMAAVELDKLRALGTVRVVESSKNAQVPEGPMARARFDVTLGNAEPMVSPEDGVGARLRQGLQTSLNGLAFSLMLIVIGVCLVGPFLLLAWGGWKLLRRGRNKQVAVVGASA
jgi:hypothetical protein